MAVELRTHWQGEGEGLFAVMREDGEYLAYIHDLVRGHRELEAFLATLDLEDAAQREALVRAVDELHHHIAKEEDGLFPASLTALSGEQCDRAIAAWGTAHGSDQASAQTRRAERNRSPPTDFERPRLASSAT